MPFPSRMLAKRVLSTRATAGGLVIAGGDPPFRRRLLKSFASEPAGRTVVDLPARDGLEGHVAALVPSVVLFYLGPEPEAATFDVVSALSAVAKTIVLADADDDALAIRALKAGAGGFCPRDTSPALIRKAVQLVEAGEIWVGRRVMLRLISVFRKLGVSSRLQLALAIGPLEATQTKV